MGEKYYTLSSVETLRQMGPSLLHVLLVDNDEKNVGFYSTIDYFSLQ